MAFKSINNNEILYLGYVYGMLSRNDVRQELFEKTDITTEEMEVIDSVFRKLHRGLSKD